MAGSKRPHSCPSAHREPSKAILPDHLAATGSEIILGNTYHLMLRPGEKVVADLGDLHRFMAWPGPILTDSGGFQVFSLSDINQLSDEGVTFKSHIDGKMIHLTPERSIEVQNALAQDIIMAFDECPRRMPPLNIIATRCSGPCGGQHNVKRPMRGQPINPCLGSCKEERTSIYGPNAPTK